MSKGIKNIFSVLAILTITISVFACSYTSMNAMAGMEMGGVSDSATQTQHLDHAHSLTMAIMPTFILLVLACAVIIFFYKSEVLDFSLVFLHSIYENSPPAYTKPKRFSANPRSPPFS